MNPPDPSPNCSPAVRHPMLEVAIAAATAAAELIGRAAADPDSLQVREKHPDRKSVV